MVIPKILRQLEIDMTTDESVDFFLTARMIGDKLEKHLNCTSTNFSIQDGPEA
jgi:diadenosine tetraphosphate (Ap4A) HIT family hydrolase